MQRRRADHPDPESVPEALPRNVPPGRSRRVAAALTAACTLLIAVGYLCAFAGDRGAWIGAWLMALAVPGLVVSMMALGLLRRAPAGRPALLALAATWLALAAAYVGGLVVPSGGPGSTTVLGFPLAAAVVIYGAGIPLLFLPFVYARTFERERDDVEQLRAITRPRAPDASRLPGVTPPGR